MATTAPDDVRLVTTETVAGREIAEHLGIVRGNTVRARNIGFDLFQALRNLVGGELRGYSALMTETRGEAVERMLAEAREMGADAVVNVRFETSEIAGSSAELVAYGTAVRLE